MIMLKKLLSAINRRLHAVVTPWFFSKRSPLSIWFGDFGFVRSWVGGTWTYFWDEETLSAYWICFKGVRTLTSEDFPPMKRGRPFVEHYPPRD